MNEIIDAEVTSTSVAILPPDVSSKVSALDTLDPEAQARAVTAMLSHSRTGLLAAIAAQDLPGIVEFKAKAAAIQEITKQLRLGKDMQLDAAEFVRRAERGLGVAIREGQKNGTVNSVGTHMNRGNGYQSGRESLTSSSKMKPTDLAPSHELHGANKPGEGIYAFTDNVSDEQFEDALDEARDEKNLSRANVARKAKAKADERFISQDDLDALNTPPASPKPTLPRPRREGAKSDPLVILGNVDGMLRGIVTSLEFIHPDDITRSKERDRATQGIRQSLNQIRKMMKEIENG